MYTVESMVGVPIIVRAKAFGTYPHLTYLHDLWAKASAAMEHGGNAQLTNYFCLP